eukprot:51077-Eustigmatos_ZCMA.PRE.1
MTPRLQLHALLVEAEHSAQLELAALDAAAVRGSEGEVLERRLTQVCGVDTVREARAHDLGELTRQCHARMQRHYTAEKVQRHPVEPQAVEDAVAVGLCLGLAERAVLYVVVQARHGQRECV